MATTRTTTAKQTPAYDFDNWSEEDEDRAIAALVPDVKSIIVERRFIGRFLDGDTVEVPLTLSLDDVDALQNEGASPVDQFRTILKQIGGDDAAAKFSRHDLAETVILAEKYFRTLARVQMAAFPES